MLALSCTLRLKPVHFILSGFRALFIWFLYALYSILITDKAFANNYVNVILASVQNDNSMSNRLSIHTQHQSEFIMFYIM